MLATLLSTISVMIAVFALRDSQEAHKRAVQALHQRGWRENTHTAPAKTPTGRRPLVLPPLPCGKPNLLIESYRTRMVETGVGHGNN